MLGSGGLLSQGCHGRWRTAGEIHEQDMRDLDYRREYERTRLANDVAIRVIQYRLARGLSQAGLARMLGWRQPNVARLESGEHEPTVATLARLADALGEDFSVDIKRSGVKLRLAPRESKAAADETVALVIRARAEGQILGGYRRYGRDLARSCPAEVRPGKDRRQAAQTQPVWGDPTAGGTDGRRSRQRLTTFR